MQSCVARSGGDDRENAGNPWTRLLVMPARCDALRRIRLSFHDEHDHGTSLCVLFTLGSNLDQDLADCVRTNSSPRTTV